jgi:hypothetical protein
VLSSAVVVVGQKAYAPLPDKVVAARTVMLVNQSGTARFGDDLYHQIKAWNRWQVVTDRGKADLVLVLSPSDLDFTIEPGSRNSGIGTMPRNFVLPTSSGVREAYAYEIVISMDFRQIPLPQVVDFAGN